MSEDRFEWDDAKGRSNFAKHGVTFQSACRVFNDIFALELLDPDSAADETRYVIIAIVDGIPLTRGLHGTRRSHSNHLSEEGNEP
jgi:uncharacterized DUF497 family protein